MRFSIISAFIGRSIWHKILKKHGTKVAYVMGDVDKETLDLVIKYMPDYINENKYDFWLMLYTVDFQCIDIIKKFNDRAIRITKNQYDALTNFWRLTNIDKRFVYIEELFTEKNLNKMIADGLFDKEDYIKNGVLRL